MVHTAAWKGQALVQPLVSRCLLQGTYGLLLRTEGVRGTPKPWQVAHVSTVLVGTKVDGMWQPGAHTAPCCLQGDVGRWDPTPVSGSCKQGEAFISSG
jgi:hypothetical protein